MKTRIFFFLLLALSMPCYVKAQDPVFAEHLDTAFTSGIVKLANPLDFDVLCIAQDCTVYNPVKGSFAPIKGNFGTAWYLPGNFSTPGLTSGTMFVTNKTNEKNANLGDGGGLIKFNVNKNEDGKWEVVPSGKVGKKMVYYESVGMEALGGSIGNGDITLDKYTQDAKTFLMSEDMLVKSNAELSTGMSDLSDYTVPDYLTKASNPALVVPAGKKLNRYQQMNWMVEVDANNGNALQKLYTMGRFNHAYCVKGAGGFYMTTGTTPSVLFKWYTYEETEREKGGELYFYKQNADGSGDFVSLNLHKQLPTGEDSTWQSFDSLLVVQDQALRAGATMFANLSGMAIDIVEGSDVLYIAERGIDNSGDLFTNTSIKYNGVLAKHLETKDAEDGLKDGVVHDYYGRILALTFESGLNIQVMLEGGKSTNGKNVLSNPETIRMVNGPVNLSTYDPDKYMVIQENLNGIDQERNPIYVTNINNKINEVYYLKCPTGMDYSKPLLGPTAKKVDDLNLFLICPKGTISKGSSLSDISLTYEKDDTYFVSINNTNLSNPAPFNRSAIVAVNGFWKSFVSTSINPSSADQNSFHVWPNPVSSTLHFDKSTDIGLYNASGTLIKVYRNVETINVEEMNPGIYFIQNKENQTQKLIIQ